jgi:hypothetical protein
MGYPELDQDESIILETRNVKFKSISLDAILTNKRIILIDSKKDIIPPQDIPLASIRIVEMGENAIRDPFLLLILSTTNGEKRQMVITFSRQAGAERKRECNEWVKKLDSLRPAPVPDIVPDDLPVPGEEPVKTPEVSPPARAIVPATRPEKKKIEIARPLSKIIEKSPVSPVPIETSSLPSGTFCSRCGNRVPLRSTFCNHCGTPIIHVPGQAGTPQPAVPQVQIPVPPPVVPAAERQSRPIEQIIHSIEPLIEDSVPRTRPSPLLQKNAPDQKEEPTAPSEPATPESPQESTPQVIWPVLSTAGSPMAPAKGPAPAETESPPPFQNPVPDAGKPNYRAVGILVVAIIAIIIGVVLLANFTAGPSGVPQENATVIKITTLVTPLTTSKPQTPGTPLVTTLMTPAPTQLMIPPKGVWVRVAYPGTFTGSIGTPGDIREVTNSGDLFYQISTTNGTVAVSLQKMDGSANKLEIEVYKNGAMVAQDSTIAPKGIVDIQFDLKTIPAAGVNSTTSAG